MSQTRLNQITNHKRLKELQRHFLGKPTLVKLQFWANNNDASSGIIHALAQKILAETSLLSLQHVGKRSKFAFIVAGKSSFAGPHGVVEERIHGLL